MRLYLFTNSFPYGKSETFLENEIPFLHESFDKLVFIPLYKEDNDERKLPENSSVWQPILAFNPKNKKALLRAGIFNNSPIAVFFKEFFEKKVYSNKKRIWNYFTSLLLFRAMYKNKNVWNKLFDNIQTEDKLYFYWGDKSALIIPFLKNKLSNKALVRFHGSDIYENAKGGYIPFRKYVFPKIDCFMPISRNGKEYLINQYPLIVNPEKIQVSRLGIFDKGLNPNRTNELFHLLSCSNLIPLKRVHLIVEALMLIDQPIEWTHIGSGTLFEDIKTCTQSLPSNIKVNMPGSLRYDEVIDFYKNHHIDLFINVSSSEGIPVSIMEALSFGIPVMASNVGGTSEIVDDEVGELINAEIKSAELAEKITKFINQNNSDYRKNARKRWNKLCNADSNYKAFSKFIKEA